MGPIHDGRHQNEKREREREKAQPKRKTSCQSNTLSHSHLYCFYFFFFFLSFYSAFSLSVAAISNWKSIHIYNFNRQHFNSIIHEQKEGARSIFSHQYLQRQVFGWRWIWVCVGVCESTPKRLDVDFLFVSTLKAVIIFDVTVIFSVSIYLLAQPSISPWIYNVAPSVEYESESPFLFWRSQSSEFFFSRRWCVFTLFPHPACSRSHSRFNTRNDVERCVENIKWKIIACGKKGRYPCIYCELKSKNENNSYAKMVFMPSQYRMWQENINERVMETEAEKAKWRREQKWKRQSQQKNRKKIKIKWKWISTKWNFSLWLYFCITFAFARTIEVKLFHSLLCSFFL